MRLKQTIEQFYKAHSCSNMKSMSLQHQICNLVGSNEFKVVSLFQRFRHIILSEIYFTFVSFVLPLLVHVELYSGSVFWHMMHASGSTQGSYDNIKKISPPPKKKESLSVFWNFWQVYWTNVGSIVYTSGDSPFIARRVNRVTLCRDWLHRLVYRFETSLCVYWALWMRFHLTNKYNIYLKVQKLNGDLKSEVGSLKSKIPVQKCCQKSHTWNSNQCVIIIIIKNKNGSHKN